MDTALAAARGGAVKSTTDKVGASASVADAALTEAMTEEESNRSAPAAGTVSVRRDSGAQQKAEQEDALQQLVRQKTQAAGKKKTVEHVVSKGETLSGIASRYKVSTLALRDHNKLPDQHVRIGQKLRIPVSN